MDDLNITPVRHGWTIPTRTDDATIPGKRDRKFDGSFSVGDLILGRYKVLAELGQGGMGIVFRCLDEISGIEIALKALPPELSHNTLEMEDIKENFQLVSKLVHQNIAISKQLERDNATGNYYLIMECCEGRNLRHWLRQNRKEGKIRLEDILPIVQQVAAALDYAHEMKIMHRDIKPGNIMIDNAGKIKVLDFGLAAQIHTSMTRVSMAYHGTSGTGPYMAPEQWRGRAQGASADQYALAVMTYEMLAGHLPFESTDAAVLQQAVLTQTPETVAGLPPAAQDALKRALSKNPSERFDSCSDFAAALGKKKINVSRKTNKAPFGKWIAAMIVLALLGAGGTGYYLFDKQQKAKQAAEQAERERLAKFNEEELDSENTALKIELTDKIAEIDQKNYDPAQTFGEKIKKMKTAFAVAQEVKLMSTANKEYKKALKLADWILTNGEQRKDAGHLKRQAESNKNTAEKYEVQTFAPKLHTSAGKTYSQAVKCYNELKFAEAKKYFAESAKEFKTAADTAFDRKLQFLKDKAKECEKNSEWNKLKVRAEKIRPLNSALADQLTAKADNELKKLALERQLKPARTAKAERNWQSVYDYAVAALEIESGNAEAQRLKLEAEPALEIIATVDGERVPAEAKFNVQTIKTFNKVFRGFTGNNDYKASLTYKKGKNEYTGEIKFTCNWMGPKQLTVALRKIDFPKTVNCNGVMLKMIKIKAGTFNMGSPHAEKGRYNDEKQHQVTLTKDYWLGKFEVTQAQWQAVMGYNPSNFKGDTRPVEKVSWNDAKEFCNKLNEKYAGKLPEGYKFDLPTEAQWEYACRAGTTTALNNGKNLTDEKYNCKNLAEVAWYYYRDKENQTHPAGLKHPNALGLYDMHGNVWEWCRDWHAGYEGDSTDPVGPSSGSNRVIRGGSWSDYARNCRSAYRYNYGPGSRYNALGFRLALVPVQ